MSLNQVGDVKPEEVTARVQAWGTEPRPAVQTKETTWNTEVFTHLIDPDSEWSQISDNVIVIFFCFF